MSIVKLLENKMKIMDLELLEVDYNQDYNQSQNSKKKNNSNLNLVVLMRKMKKRVKMILIMQDLWKLWGRIKIITKTISDH